MIIIFLIDHAHAMAMAFRCCCCYCCRYQTQIKSILIINAIKYKSFFFCAAFSFFFLNSSIKLNYKSLKSNWKSVEKVLTKHFFSALLFAKSFVAYTCFTLTKLNFCFFLLYLSFSLLYLFDCYRWMYNLFIN